MGCKHSKLLQELVQGLDSRGVPVSAELRTAMRGPCLADMLTEVKEVEVGGGEKYRVVPGYYFDRRQSPDLRHCPAVWFDLTAAHQIEEGHVLVHYKGGRYQVEGLSCDATDQAARLLYFDPRQEYKLWDRLLTEVFELVTWPDGTIRSRFVRERRRPAPTPAPVPESVVLEDHRTNLRRDGVEQCARCGLAGDDLFGRCVWPPPRCDHDGERLKKAKEKPEEARWPRRKVRGWLLETGCASCVALVLGERDPDGADIPS